MERGTQVEGREAAASFGSGLRRPARTFARGATRAAADRDAVT
jgi:hypothetical protein